MEQILSIILGIFQLTTTIYILIYEYRRKSTGVFLWGMMLIIFSLTHFLNLFEAKKDYPLWVYDNASIFVFFFNITYIIIRSLLNKNRKQSIRFPHTLNKTKFSQTYVIVMIVLMILSVGIRVHELSKYSGGILETSWGDMLTSGGGILV